MTPESGALGQFAEVGVHQAFAVAEFDNGGIFWRAPGCHQLLALGGCGIIPGEWDEIFEEEFAYAHGVAAFAWADDFEAEDAGLSEETAAFLCGDEEFFAEMGDFVEDFAEARAGDAHQMGFAAGDAGDDDRTPGEEVDISGELAGAVGDDVTVVIGGVDDFDAAGFYDE